MPKIERSTKLSVNLRRHVLIFSIAGLIAKRTLIHRRTSSGIIIRVDLCIENRLFAKMSELRKSEIEFIRFHEMTRDTLLISSTRHNGENTDNVTMLLEEPLETCITTNGDAVTSHITLRRVLTTKRLRSGLRSLKNFGNRNRLLETSEILRTLKPGIRTPNTKMSKNLLNIPRTSASINLKPLLKLIGTTQLIDSRGSSLRKIRPKRFIRINIQTGRTGQTTRTNRASRIRIQLTSSGELILTINKVRHTLRTGVIEEYLGATRERKSDITASLRPRKSRSEIILFPTTTPNSQHVGKLRSLETAERNINRLLKILIAVPLIPNKLVSTKRENRKGETTCRLIRITRRNTHIVSKRRLRKKLTSLTCTNHRKRRHLTTIFSSSNKLFPVFPNKTIGNEKELNTSINTMHNRSNHRSETHKHLGTNLEAITGNHILNINRYKLRHIERQLILVRQIKHIMTWITNSHRIEYKTSIHNLVDCLFLTCCSFCLTNWGH
nr:MAG TPA: hypothetical protein [Bacteriophage sp.]